MKKSAILYVAAFTSLVLVAETSLFALQPPPPPRPELPTTPDARQEAIGLTRGPVHEAFAQPYAMKSGGEFVITQTPPEPIDEYPPGQLPESDAYQWVSGYWGWEPDEERFVWISGIWRRAPEGRVWNPGYWVEVEGGYTWVSGSWIKEGEAYLISQIPPDAREENPGEPPSPIHFWVPGHWLESRSGFSWSPGFWSRGYEGRVWIPFRYQWTPQGYLALQGYWDYALEERGVLYSPIAFDRIPPPTYRYTPTIVTRVDYLPTHLFVYRDYGHYCFGDYYGFRRPGVFVSWTSRRYRAYDPLRFFFLLFHRDRFNHHRHRHDYYHDHVNHRPRHTWREQRRFADRLRDDDRFGRGNFQDALLSTGFKSVLNGEDVGTRVRFNPETQDRPRWNEIVKQNVQTRQLQKRYNQDLKTLGKIEPGKGRFPAENMTRIGPLQIETRKNPVINRSGRVGGNSGKGITISPSQVPRNNNGNSRFQPSTRNPRLIPGKNADSETLKKLREQAERMRREGGQRSKQNEGRNNRETPQRIETLPRIQQQPNSQKQREAFQKEMQRRQEILKKQADEQSRRRGPENNSNRGNSNSKAPQFKSPPSKREFKQPDTKRPEFKKRDTRKQEFKRPSSSSNSSKGNSSQNKKESQKRSSGPKKKDD